MTATVVRPGRRKSRKVHHMAEDGQPLCGVRRSGEWQAEMPLGIKVNCNRCIKLKEGAK